MPLAPFVVLHATVSWALGRNPELFLGVESIPDKEYAVGKDPAIGVESIGAPRLVHGGFAAGLPEEGSPGEKEQVS